VKLLSLLHTNDRVNRVARTFLHGVIGGVAGYAVAAQADTSLLAQVAWWKGALTVGILAGVGSVGGNYVQPLIPVLRRVLPPTPAAK
jgi:hypothetical protein